jgi:hypothetical protein
MDAVLLLVVVFVLAVSLLIIGIGLFDCIAIFLLVKHEDQYLCLVGLSTRQGEDFYTEWRKSIAIKKTSIFFFPVSN